MPPPYDLPLPRSLGRYKVARYGKEGKGLRKLVGEKILGATDIDGRRFFLMKWKDLNEASLVTASDANLLCPQVVIEFYQSKVVFSSSPVKKEDISHLPCPVSFLVKGRCKVAMFIRSGETLWKVVAEKILGATDIDEQLLFLMKWKNLDEPSLVTASDANILCPQVVIAFYESKVEFRSTRSSSTVVKEENSHLLCPSPSVVKEENHHSPGSPFSLAKVKEENPNSPGSSFSLAKVKEEIKDD